MIIPTYRFNLFWLLYFSSRVLHISWAVEPISTGGPTEVKEGKDALLTCVVMSPYYNDTIIWRNSKGILSAGINRVTSDKRISILHDDSSNGRTPTGGDVWVLLIRNVSPADEDTYTCEVNSDPALKSFHTLQVSAAISTSASEDSSRRTNTSDNSNSNNNNNSTNSDKKSNLEKNTKKVNENGYKKDSARSKKPEPPPTFYIDEEDGLEPDSSNIEATVTLSHDFTECCAMLNVSKTCQGFCVLHNIIDGTTGTEPEACEFDFPNIVQCMADGRNHVPCCEKKGVPDLCSDMCRGEYTPFTDLLKSRVSCVAHTLPALQCILTGVQNIPSQPEDIVVETLTDRSLQISWSPPKQLAHTVTLYQINVTRLHTFDENDDPRTNDSSASVSVSLTNDNNMTVVNNLEPFTMYEVAVTARNRHGESLPLQRIRALTLDTESKKRPDQPNVPVIPALPDVRECCIKNGITHQSCLNRLCDPKVADFTQVPDLMVCAPWANITYSCLANNIDHSPCCKARGIPDICLPFCAGTVTTINFNKFKCLNYMSDFSSCLFQGYGVLPSAPARLHASLVSHHYAVLDWVPPKELANSVTAYHLHLRKLGFDDEYTVFTEKQSPVILQDLESATYYEAFLTAVNAHGKGAPSSRLIFQTKTMTALEPSSFNRFNLTQCCHVSGLLPQCTPLCSYDVTMSSLQQLSGTCGPQVGVLAKCFAAGRDHTPCCNRRGVSNECLPLCHGVVPAQSTECLPFAGNIIQCLEEGSDNIPGPIVELKALSVGNTSITLSWSPDNESSSGNDTNRRPIIDYLVQYGKVDNMTMYETVLRLESQVNTTETNIDLNNLETGVLYRIVVLARGEYGQSLPSSMLLINTTATAQNKDIYAVPSPPHSLTISGHSASWITITWQPPEFSHPHEPISYRVYHKTAASDMFTMTETRLLWMRFNDLTPNTQHIIFVTALGQNGLSLPSETLVAWTDPALPAHVDPPTIHPSDMVPEGGSMTVLCLALGNPAPTISLYVAGHLVRQDTSRHLVTTIHNISSDMDTVSCYADNGYGIPMQASKKINVSFAPRIQSSSIQVAAIDESVDLKCIVRARPPPKAMFWRDHDGRIPVIQGGNYDMTLIEDPNDNSQYTMTLHINKFGTQDIGDYFCHAQNPLGANTRPVSVRMRNSPPKHYDSIASCCTAQNVSSSCMSACSFYVDIESIIDRPECIVDFDKLMKCAADGSDHRVCCAQQGVPRRCLNWCRGEAIGNGNICQLQYTKAIVGCFQSNRDLLPGPPNNVVVQTVSATEVRVRWDAPVKNPATVLGYKVYWQDETAAGDASSPANRSLGVLSARSMETTDTFIRVDGLTRGPTYKLVLKAGNKHGASILTDPVRFTLADQHVTTASPSTSAGTISGILAGIVVVILAISGVIVFKKRKATQKMGSNNGAVAFENPSYLREINMETVTAQYGNNGGNVSGPTVAPAGSQQPSQAAQQQHQMREFQNIGAGIDDTHSPPPLINNMNEVNPTLYEELKLRTEGGGFKRLVS